MGQLQLLVEALMKTYKLNTINLTSDIFLSQNEPSSKLLRSLKTPSSCNKRFKYNYEKSKTPGSSSNRKDRERKNTIDEEDIMPQVGQLRTMFQREAKQIQHAVSIPRNRRNTVTHQITLQSQHEQHEAKEEKIPKCDSKILPGSETVQRIKSMNYVLVNLLQAHDQKSSAQQKIPEIKQSQIATQIKQKQSPAVNIIKSKYKHSKNANQLLKTRNIISNKYTNSIIKSYKVKTMDLFDPLQNNRKKYLLRSVEKTGPAYYIDLGNDYNLRQIYLQDLQKVELKKCVYDHKRALSNHAKTHQRIASRPFTPTISHKFQDFEPKPWDSEQKPDFLYQSKAQNLD